MQSRRPIAAVQQQVWALDKDQPVTNVQTLEDVVNERAEQRRFETTLLGVFAALALVLALVGIYGVISFSVSQRTGEIGLRLALGAKPADILRLVLLQAIGLAAIGIAIGTAGAFGLSRFLETLLFQIRGSVRANRRAHGKNQLVAWSA